MSTKEEGKKGKSQTMGKKSLRIGFSLNCCDSIQFQKRKSLYVAYEVLLPGVLAINYSRSN